MRWPPDDPADVWSDTSNRVSGTIKMQTRKRELIPACASGALRQA